MVQFDMLFFVVLAEACLAQKDFCCVVFPTIHQLCNGQLEGPLERPVEGYLAAVAQLAREHGALSVVYADGQFTAHT